MGERWKRLPAGLSRLRRRAGDACWGAVQPVLATLHAGYRGWTRWRVRRADALWSAGTALRDGWRLAPLRRRALVVVLAMLPFATAATLGVALLPGRGDSQAAGSRERAPAGSRVADDRGGAAEAPAARAAGPTADKADRAAGAGPPAPATPGDFPAATVGRRSGDRAGSRPGGRSAPVAPVAPREGGERRASTAPAPAPRAPSRRPASDRGGRPPAPAPRQPQTPPAGSAPTQPAPAPPAPEPAPPVQPPPTVDDAPQGGRGQGPKGDPPAPPEWSGGPGGNNPDD